MMFKKGYGNLHALQFPNEDFHILSDQDARKTQFSDFGNRYIIIQLKMFRFPHPWCRVRIFSHHLTRPLTLLRMRIGKGACTAALLAYINRTLFAQGQSCNKPLRTLLNAYLLRGSYNEPSIFTDKFVSSFTDFILPV